MTINRSLTLLALSQDADDNQLPPHSAATLIYMFNIAFEYKWSGYELLKQVPSKQQVHRTLRELWAGGLIVGSRVKEQPSRVHLPYWELKFQLSSAVEHNHWATKCSEVYRRVHRAKHGCNFFGAVFDLGLPASEVSALKQEVKALLQRTHPDKTDGMESQFNQMIQCRDWIKSGIDLPAATHTAGASPNSMKTLT